MKGSQQNGVFLHANDNNKTWVVRFADITDGLSNTVGIGESTVSQNVSPSNIGNGRFSIWAAGNNNGGCNGFRDGGNVFRLMEVSSFGRGVSSPGFKLNRRTSNFSDASFGSQHPGGANFLLCDGLIRFIRDGISNAAYNAAGTRNGGETAQTGLGEKIARSARQFLAGVIHFPTCRQTTSPV